MKKSTITKHVAIDVRTGKISAFNPCPIHLITREQKISCDLKCGRRGVIFGMSNQHEGATPLCYACYNAHVIKNGTGCLLVAYNELAPEKPDHIDYVLSEEQELLRLESRKPKGGV